MTTLLVTQPACLAHEMGEGHPEQPDRLRCNRRILRPGTPRQRFHRPEREKWLRRTMPASCEGSDGQAWT